MNRNWIAVAVLAFAGAGQALAQGDDDKQDGAFVGVGIGDYSSDGDISNVNFDESESVYKLFGGWRWNQFFALQADYYDLGRLDSSSGGTNLQIETSGYVARIEGTLPLAFSSSSRPRASSTLTSTRVPKRALSGRRPMTATRTQSIASVSALR